MRALFNHWIFATLLIVASVALWNLRFEALGKALPGFEINKEFLSKTKDREKINAAIIEEEGQKILQIFRKSPQSGSPSVSFNVDSLEDCRFLLITGEYRSSEIVVDDKTQYAGRSFVVDTLADGNRTVPSDSILFHTLGTHDWKKFIKPSDLGSHFRASGLRVDEIIGLTYNPLTKRYKLENDVDVNYMIATTRIA